MKIRPGTKNDARDVQDAIKHLRLARTLLAKAGAVKAADKVRRALKSAEGAERHAWHRARRTETHALTCDMDGDCTCRTET